MEHQKSFTKVPGIVLGGWLCVGAAIVPGIANPAPTAGATETGDRVAQVDQIDLAEKLIYGDQVSANPTRGETILVEAAGAGDPRAKLVLGRAYTNGKSFSGKSAVGVRLLEEASSAGLQEADLALGQLYLWGTIDVGKDATKAMTYLEKAADAKDARALRLLGEELLNGWSLPRDVGRGETMLKDLASAGDKAAKAALGRAYVQSADLGAKFAEGVILLEEAAAANEASASAALGELYLWGAGGIKADRTKAQSYLEKAVAAGNSEAERILGEQLTTGWVLAPDVTRGEALLQKRISDGDARAMLALGRAYVSGTDIHGKGAEGEELLQRAADKGQSAAFNLLSDFYLWGTPEVKAQPSKAMASLEQGTRLGDKDAQRTLGQQLMNGWVFAPDPDRGADLLQKLADAGDVKAKSILGEAYLNGVGVKRDKSRGGQFLEQAAQAGDAGAYETLGNSLLWTAKSGPQRRLAREYLTRAATAGRSNAWLSLAQGSAFKRLDAEGTRSYALYEKMAREAGIEGIEILSAQRMMWGLGTKRSLSKAVKHLENSAAQGNKEALVYAVSLFRDGRPWEYKRNLRTARTLLEKYGSSLGDERLKLERYLIDAKTARTSDALGPMAAKLRNEFANSVGLQKRVFDANPNLSVYMAQTVLTDHNIYKGRINGLATAATITALRKACGGKLPDTHCAGPLVGPGVLPIIASKL